jgi:hypothetical protein
MLARSIDREGREFSSSALSAHRWFLLCSGTVLASLRRDLTADQGSGRLRPAMLTWS